MENIIITKVGLQNILDLQKIGKVTFSETFASGNTEANMNKYLEESFSIEKLTSELENKTSEFYLAKLNTTIIGYLKINFGASQTELKDPNALEIERIYVLKQFHGKNVGQLIYEKAIALAREKKVNYLWLGVWEKNLRAIRFYQKNGFVEFDKHIFRLGDDEQTDLMMKLKLN